MKKRLTVRSGNICDIMGCIQFNCNGARDRREECDAKRIYARLREYENEAEELEHRTVKGAIVNADK